MSLAQYLKSFLRLRTCKDRKKWLALTTYQAPHKPFLLLSIMDLIAQGLIIKNFIEPSFELIETFNGYWKSIMPLGSKTSMPYPFPRLKTDGFWHLIPNPTFENQININFSSMAKLREVCAGARMDEELFQLMCNPETREQLRAALIETYFAPEIRTKVLEQGHLNYAVYRYSKKLLKVDEWKKDFGKVTDESDWQKKIRDSGFRKTIVSLYRHRCALCGIRMLTPEGHTIVDAAHIKPWKDSFDDRPTNGMALCKLCHWSFDKGLVSVSKEYQVLVSKRVMVEQNFPGHILTLTDRPIFTPEKEIFWPEQDNLHWHRKNTFRR
ncbi:MAG: putative restriction endonuclease [Desulfobacteraceae bacterium Eth-SRB2]|nr:MAG: putative restriction endonuclease [Desulfobacteraceae bacterium Eth-SRB2]